jgi:DNA (cytosine-5)-methyltransferase 1
MNANGAQRMPDKDNFGAVLEPVAHAFKVRGGSETETGEQGGTPGKKAGKGYLGSDELAFTIGTTQDQQIAQPIAYSFDSLASNSMKSSNPVSGCNQVEVAKTIDTTTQDPSKNQGGIGIAQPIAVDVYNQSIDGQVSATITEAVGGSNTSGPKVLQPVPYRKTKRAQSKDDHETWEQDEKTNTLNAFDTGDIRTTQAVVQPPTIIDRAAFNQGQNAQYDIKIEQGETMSSLVAKGPHGVATQNISPTITQCKGSRGGSSMEALDEVSAVFAQQPTMAIRRLTPRECERLQGFPDDWTLIPYRNKPADQCPDGPRYKACGNSMAVPVMAYLGKRIQMVEDIIDNKAI